jgi:flavodoxin
MSIVKKFNDYFLNENKELDKDTLDKVSKYITKRFKYETEDLIVFTYWISKILNYDNLIFISRLEMSEEFKDVSHVYIIIGDKYFDGKGFHTREDLYKKHNFSKYSYNDYTFHGNLTDLIKCIKEKKLEITNKIEKELKIILQKIKEDK